MKIYIIRNEHKDIQDVTINADKAIELVDKNKDFHCVTYEVDVTDTELRPLCDFEKRYYNIMNYDSIIKFGKYKGKSIGDIINTDKKYLVWAVENNIIELDEECLNLISC